MSALYDAESFARLGADEIIKTEYKGMTAMFTGNWMSHFGTMPHICCWMWKEIDPFRTMPRGVKQRHLLWALYFLRSYPRSENTATSAVRNKECDKKPLKVDPKTWRKWTKEFVTAISYLESRVIIWKKRFIGDTGNQALVTIDGTDMNVELRFDQRFFSHKFKSGGLRYELGVCIATGHIVWINGPFRCGKNDITIARDGILGSLEEGEMVEADAGYEGEVWTIKTPQGFHFRSEEEEKMKQDARSRHESVNRRVKIFKVLGKDYHHSLHYHSACFRAVAVITQLNFTLGEKPPFQVEYYDDRE